MPMIPLVRRSIAAVVAITGGFAAIVACSEETASKRQSRVEVSPDAYAPITFGMSASLTGAYAEVGNALADGTRSAEQVINGLGGINGRQVKFDIRDDQSDKGPILQGVVKELLAQNVAAIMGPGASSQCAIAQTLCYGKVPQISAWSTSSLLTSIDNGDGPSVGPKRWFFRTPPPDEFQARAVHLFATSGPPRRTEDAGADGGTASPLHKCQRPYVLYGDDVYGQGIAQGLAKAFMQRDGIQVELRKVPSDEKANYTDDLGDLASKHADCLVPAVYPDVAAHVLNELHALRTTGSDPLPNDFFVVGVDSSYDKSVLQKTIVGGSRSTANGIYGTAPDTAPARADYDAFVTIYRNYKGDPTVTPPAYAAHAFDAAIMVSLAVQKAGSTNPVLVRDGLFALSGNGKIFHIVDLAAAITAIKGGVEINYAGASGEVDFDENGNVLADYIIWTVENDTFKTVQRVKSTDLKF